MSDASDLLRDAVSRVQHAIDAGYEVEKVYLHPEDVQAMLLERDRYGSFLVPTPAETETFAGIVFERSSHVVRGTAIIRVKPGWDYPSEE